MQRITKYLLQVLFLAVLHQSAMAQVAPGEINTSMLKESIEAVTGHKGPIVWKKLAISKELKKTVAGDLKIKKNLADTLYAGLVEKDRETYHIIPDIAPSKSELFSYVLYLDAEKKIVDVDVLEYRENYGYEIDYSFFRRQFKGMGQPKEIRFNRSIQNISGATISARNMTSAVHDLMLIIKHLELD